MTTLSFDYIETSIKPNIQSNESDLATRIASLGANPSTADLLSMQQGIQKYGVHIQLQTTIVKEFAETLKGIVQKAG